MASPLVNFVNPGNLVSLSDGIHGSETGTLILPVDWAVVRIKYGGACEVLSIMCGYM